MQETVSTKFKTQLGQLMQTIGATSVQYVRCIKPNPLKSKEVFSMQMVVEQLRCAGVIGAIRISRAGYPNKIAHAEFLARFGVLAPQIPKGVVARHVVHFAPVSSSFPSGSYQSLPKRGAPTSPSKAAPSTVNTLAVCKAVLEVILEARRDRSKPQLIMCASKVISLGNRLLGRYDVGSTRVYFKAGILEELEGRRAKVLQQSATTIERYVRGARKRRLFLRQMARVVAVQAVARAWKARSSYRRVRKHVTVVQVCIDPP